MEASTGLSSYAGEILQAIGNENVNGIVRPIDILALQEMKDGGFTIESQIVTALNNIYGAGTYAYSTLNATGDGYEKVGMVYNTKTVQIIDQVAFKDSLLPEKQDDTILELSDMVPMRIYMSIAIIIKHMTIAQLFTTVRWRRSGYDGINIMAVIH